jgi:hypothetical protein
VAVQNITGSFIVTLKDASSRVLPNRLISEEGRSGRVLSSILLAELVPHVQAGKKNFSFSVQTASVLFLGIVLFTLWCGGNEATCVMATLNSLFKGLDSELMKYDVLTKSKCIRDYNNDRRRNLRGGQLVGRPPKGDGPVRAECDRRRLQ